jgi:hypothetical protein
MRRGKNALAAADSWPTFTFLASREDIADPFAFSAFLVPSLSRRLEGSLYSGLPLASREHRPRDTGPGGENNAPRDRLCVEWRRALEAGAITDSQ